MKNRNMCQAVTSKAGIHSTVMIASYFCIYITFFFNRNNVKLNWHKFQFLDGTYVWCKVISAQQCVNKRIISINNNKK
jgi:hypothetical protein